MKISVVVPAFNEEKLLADSLRSIRAAMESFVRLDCETELVVCDNNSTDRTAEIARAAGAKVVFEPINQISRARNCGAAAATGDWLIFVDADSHPSPELFGEVAAQIQSGKVLAGGCTVKMDEFHPIATWVAHVWNLVSRVNKWFAGSFGFCEAAAFRKIGGFSLDLFASEEIELSQRLKALARERKKKIVILHRHPLITSGRKLNLYSRAEHFHFVRKAILNPFKTVKNRDACAQWYDGRR